MLLALLGIAGLLGAVSATSTSAAPHAETATVAEAAEAPEPDDDNGPGEEGAVDDLGAVSEVRPSTVAGSGVPRYTAEISDAELKRRFASDRASLGSIALGPVDAGRLLNGETFPPDPRWFIVDPPNTWATHETVDYLSRGIIELFERYPDTLPVRINHISAKDGGFLPPHITHQVGRDVDLGFCRSTANGGQNGFDLARNWTLLKALFIGADLEVILVDRRIQKQLFDYALSIGEDRAWLDSIFHAGPRSLLQHARRHRDHFHLRFYSARSQELGRRVQPLLGKDDTTPQIVRHLIRNGDSLGKIARRYGVSIAAIKRTNRMKSDFIRAGRALAIPVRARDCQRCGEVPEVYVPPRRLPPGATPTPVLAAVSPAPTPSAEVEAEAAVVAPDWSHPRRLAPD
ncbi:MAG: LysM peptidoglycan-binding domain-containing protein [Myxococcota bacterium]